MGSAATEVCNLPLLLSQTMQCLITLFFNMKVNFFLKKRKVKYVDYISTHRAMTPCWAMELLGFLLRLVTCGKGGHH
jgi:hypothetical protein